ncbi:MAG: ABC transporter permease [Candidatus Bathyarchaeia archaeon]
MEFRVYLLRRLILLFFVMIGVTFLVFVIAVVVPKDPAFLWAGGTNVVTEEQLAAVRTAYHLNEPWYMQYWWYLTNILQGNLGVSPVRHVPIALELAAYLPNSIELGIFALMLSIVVGISTGIVSATRKDTAVDHASRLSSLSLVSMPNFWIAILMQWIFYYYLGWLPDPGGNVNQTLLFRYPLHTITGFNTLDALLTGNWAIFGSLIQHMIMPGLVIAFYPTAVIARITRASMLEVMSQDFIRTARAYGLQEKIVVYKFALKNAMIPTTTTIGLAVGWLLTGSVVVETIFYWPGIGRYAVDAIQNFDFPSLIGYVLVASLLYATANLAVDILYGFIDPRIRQG